MHNMVSRNFFDRVSPPAPGSGKRPRPGGAAPRHHAPLTSGSDTVVTLRGRGWRPTGTCYHRSARRAAAVPDEGHRGQPPGGFRDGPTTVIRRHEPAGRGAHAPGAQGRVERKVPGRGRFRGDGVAVRVGRSPRPRHSGRRSPRSRGVTADHGDGWWVDPRTHRIAPPRAHRRARTRPDTGRGTHRPAPGPGQAGAPRPGRPTATRGPAGPPATRHGGPAVNP